MSDLYQAWMREAIDLAQKGRFRACPNPTVGAVLVQGNEIVARGWHKGYGEAHAEVYCLNDALARGAPVEGGTMVVTLEPCRHYGKTPPCTQALKAAGIKKLVYGTTDPNAQACGGAELLAQSGMEVIGPVCEQECRDLIADFTIWQTTDRPYVMLKLAASLDGRIATRAGNSRWISNKESRKAVHRLRAGIAEAGGAVLIGGGTFRTDNPRLTARPADGDKQPIACILTSRLPKADADFALLRDRPQETVFFASPAAAASTSAEALRKLGCRVLALGPGDNGEPDFASMLRILRSELGCLYVLCEGGAYLALSLLEHGQVDEFHLFLAPLIFGDDKATPLFAGRQPLGVEDALAMRICSAKAQSGDAHLILRPRASQTCSQA